MSLISFFRHKLAFQPVDPLGDGLGDDIVQEQSEPEAIQLEEDIEPDFNQKWDTIVDDIHKDPDWVDFSDDN